MKRRRLSEFTDAEVQQFAEKQRERRLAANRNAAPFLACTFAEHALDESGLPLEEGDSVEFIEDQNGVSAPTLIRSSRFN